jgi:hypothetical protein
MNVKKVIFFNAFHKGDLHLSRTMVKRFVEAFPDIEFGYMHQNDPYLLKDLGLKYYGWRRLSSKDQTGVVQIDDTLYLNTWFCSYDNEFMNRYNGITFDTLYFVFEKHLSLFGRTWADIEKDPKELYPSIDWSKYNCAGVDRYRAIEFPKYKKNVIICNGPALSGQSKPFDWNIIIDYLSRKFPNVQFICTDNGYKKKTSNVAFTSDIIGIKECDLNEIAYLSTFCEVIIGRTSGPNSYTMIKENSFDSRKTLLSFSSINAPIFYLDVMAEKIKYDADVRNYDIDDIQEIERLITEAIEK